MNYELKKITTLPPYSLFLITPLIAYYLTLKKIFLKPYYLATYRTPLLLILYYLLLIMPLLLNSYSLITLPKALAHIAQKCGLRRCRRLRRLRRETGQQFGRVAAEGYAREDFRCFRI